MYINYYVGSTPHLFWSKWDALMHRPSDCVWMVPGTFDCDGNSTLGDE